MRGFRKFCKRGFNSATLTRFFYIFFFGGGGDPNTTLSGPSLARQRNAIEMVFHGRADDGSTLNAGLVALRILRISWDPVHYC